MLEIMTVYLDFPKDLTNVNTIAELDMAVKRKFIMECKKEDCDNEDIDAIRYAFNNRSRAMNEALNLLLTTRGLLESDRANEAVRREEESKQ